MKPILPFASLLLTACAVVPRDPQASIRVLSRSHNRSEVDVYLLCGDRDARWLGVVSEEGAEAFEIPVRQARCVEGLNFFLVVRDQGRGYWVGPFRPRAGEYITLVIEKYAGLSTASLPSELR